jgi:DNA-binding transcriptional LysR family regulator
MRPQNCSVTLEGLRAFVVLADVLNFARAAHALSTAPSVFTRHIQQLEQALGTPLFARDEHTVRLTSVGEELLARGQSVIASVEDIQRTARRLRNGEAGRVRIGFTAGAARRVVPALLRRFTRTYPHVDAVLVAGRSDQQMRELTSGAIDVAILRPPRKWPPGISYCVLGEERFVAAIPKDHQLATKAQVALRELESQPLILLHPRTEGTVHDEVRKAFRAEGVKLRTARHVNHLSAVIAYVAAGYGVSVIPASAADRRVSDVVYCPLAAASLGTMTVLAFPANHRAPVVDAVIRCAQRSTEGV